MLGRILENLAAKINPTTNQQASKTGLMGVFYTPRGWLITCEGVCSSSEKKFR